MSKSMVFVAPVAALESRRAWRSEPGPLSPVLVTRKADRSVRSSIHSRRGLELNQLGKGRSARGRRLRGLGALRMVVMVTLQTGQRRHEGQAFQPDDRIASGWK